MMQFTCPQPIFRESLSFVGTFTDSKSDSVILGAVLISASKHNQIITLTAFDGVMGLERSFDAEVNADGCVAILAKTITSVVSRLPKDYALEIKQVDNELILKSKGRFKINLLNPEDHPGLPNLDEPTSIILNANTINIGLQYCLNAASSEPSKQILTGVRIANESDSICFAATDSHQLATIEVESAGRPFDPIVVPRSSLAELQKLIKDKTDDIEVAIAHSLIQFTVNNCKIVSPLIPGDYPQFKRLIPTDFIGELTCDRKTLLQSVESAIAIGSNTTPVLFSFDIQPNILTIKAIAKQVGESTFEIDISLIGDSISIGFNSKYMVNMLRSLQSKEIKIQFCSADRPVIFSEIGGTKCLYLLMPVIIRD